MARLILLTNWPKANMRNHLSKMPLRLRIRAVCTLLVLATFSAYKWEHNTISATPCEYARMFYERHTSSGKFGGTFDAYLETMLRDGGRIGAGPRYSVAVLYPSLKGKPENRPKVIDFQISRDGNAVSQRRMSLSAADWENHRKFDCSPAG